MSSLRIEGLTPQIDLQSRSNTTQKELNVGDGVSFEENLRSFGTESGPVLSKDFTSLLQKTINTVNKHQVDADHAIKELVSGRTKNIHETMLAVERAELSLKLMTQVRNKIMEAYREVMRMQV